MPTSLIALSALIHITMAENFVQTCQDPSTYGLIGSMMAYSCYTENGGLVSSSIDLNECITNLDGHLISGGSLVYPIAALNVAVMRYILKDTIFSGFFETCNTCVLENTILACYCRKRSGDELHDFIYLS